MAETIVLQDVDFSLLTNRVLEMRVIRMKEFPSEPTPIRTGIQVTTEAKVGRMEQRANALGIAVKLVLELRFSEESSPGVEGSPYAEIQLSTESIMEAAKPIEGDASKMSLGAGTMNRVTQLLLGIADTHLRQIIAMTAMPVVISGEKIVEIARKSA